MCAASSEQLAVRYCTKSHINQKNRQIYNKKKTGWDNRTKPLPVCLMEIVYRLLVKGVILVDFLLRRSEHVMWVAELLCVLQSLLTCYNTGWISRQGDKFFEDTKKSKIFVCVYVCVFGRGCQVELTVVLLLLICCVTQMGVYLSHKLSFCSREGVKMQPIIPLTAFCTWAFLVQWQAFILYIYDWWAIQQATANGLG